MLSHLSKEEIIPYSPQAGVLQGDIKDMMVMDVWQASLMRALAGVQLKGDEGVQQRVAEASRGFFFLFDALERYNGSAVFIIFDQLKGYSHLHILVQLTDCLSRPVSECSSMLIKFSDSYNN